LRLELSRDGNAIESWKTLEMNTPQMDEPTNGTVAGRNYYFVAASQGHLFDGKDAPAAGELKAPVIMKIALP
jgi:hypothetical protein